MENLILYGNGPAENHGCEALTRTIQGVLSHPVTCLCKNPGTETKYISEKDISFVAERMPSSKDPESIIAAILKRTHIDNHALMRFRTKEIKNLLGKGDVAVSAGGDNYCYGTFYKLLAQYNAFFRKKGLYTVLFGCSVEPDLMEIPEVLEDLKSYSLILARESITYEALVSAGAKNAFLVPDSAFTLPKVEKELPEGFTEGEMVGINVSPLITEKETVPGMTMKNYRALIRYIIENTTLGVALIPHVVVRGSDDRTVLRSLYADFQGTGRVIMIEDANCMELKGYIAKCKLFVGARTHATIAAYSSFVPTLVVGYSVKARGIAKDLFGTDEGYVLPVQSLENETDLTTAFCKILEKEAEIRAHLTSFIPGYTEKTSLYKTYIDALKEG